MILKRLIRCRLRGGILAEHVLHWAQGEHNNTFAAELVSEEQVKFKDWAIIAAFYAAVHYVEAARDKKFHQHSYDHGMRSEFVSQNFAKNVEAAYRKLYQQSLLLRYLSYESKKAQTPGGDFYDDETVKKFVNRDLNTIKTSMAAFGGFNKKTD